MKRLLTISIALALAVTIALPAMAMTIDHPPVRIETKRDSGTFSLTVDNLPETFVENQEKTRESYSEYACRVKFCDGKAFYDIGAIHFKEPYEGTRRAELFDFCTLYRGDGRSASFVSQCFADRDGDTVTFMLEGPIFDMEGNPVKIDFENIIAFGYQMQNLVEDKPGSETVFYRILDDGAMEEISWDTYCDLLPSL